MWSASGGSTRGGGWAGFAPTCLGHNGDVPKPVIGRLGGGRGGGKGNCGRGKKQSRKHRDAIVAHESFPRFGVMTRLIRDNVSKVCCVAVTRKVPCVSNI